MDGMTFFKCLNTRVEKEGGIIEYDAGCIVRATVNCNTKLTKSWLLRI